MRQKVELVVFDIAGTTVRDNGEIAVAFQTALDEYGYQVPVHKIEPLMGYKKTEAITKMLVEFEADSKKITAEYVDKIHARFLQLMIDHYTSTRNLSPLPHVEEVLSWLKQH